MKYIRPRIILLISVILLTGNMGTNGLVGGGTPTYTTLTVPSELYAGNVTTISSLTLTESDTVPPIGDVTFISLKEPTSIGPETDGSVVPVSLPVIEFQPTTDLTVYGIQIPINNITNLSGNSISWSILENPNESPLISGQINVNDLQKMITDGNILISIGTITTDPVDWSGGFNLTAWNSYYIKMEGTNANFIFEASATGSSLISLFDDTTELFETPKISLYSGNYLGREPINSSGVAQIQFEVQNYDRYILAYYGDAAFSSPSYDFQPINVTETGETPPPPPETEDPPEQNDNNDTITPPPPENPEENGEIVIIVSPGENNDDFPDNSTVPSEGEGSNQETDSTGFDVRDYIDVIGAFALWVGPKAKNLKFR